MICWNLILKTDDIGPRLQDLYDNTSSMLVLAETLGTSKTALGAAFKKYGIKPRSRGGPHLSFRRELLPENFVAFTPAQLAQATGYAVNYCRRLLAQRRKENEVRKNV